MTVSTDRYHDFLTKEYKSGSVNQKREMGNVPWNGIILRL